MTHTPEPWEAKESNLNYYNVLDSSNTIVAEVRKTFKHAAANARLIAAAPELLEALQDLVKAHKTRMGAGAMQLRVDLASRAISKATGN